MTTTKKQGSVINIAPFVDILLILFVIILVVSNFEETNETKIKELTEKTQMLEEKLSKIKREVGGFSLIIMDNKIYAEDKSKEDYKGIQLSQKDLEQLSTAITGNIHIKYDKSEENLYKEVLSIFKIKEKKSAKDFIGE